MAVFVTIFPNVRVYEGMSISSVFTIIGLNFINRFTCQLVQKSLT